MPDLVIRPLRISAEVRERVARHQESKPATRVMCGCEHASHFPPECTCGNPYCDHFPPVDHPYASVDAGTREIWMVGRVCDGCAEMHDW